MSRRVLLLAGLIAACSGGSHAEPDAGAGDGTPGVDAGGAFHCEEAPEPVEPTPVNWTGRAGASADGNDLHKTAGQTVFNSGAVSAESLAGDGYVEFTTGESSTRKLAGLSHGDGGAGYADIDFAIDMAEDGGFGVVEGGTRRGSFGLYAAGDIFRIQVSGGAVSYWKNGVEFYASEVAASLPLLLDTSLRTPGATILDAVLVEGPMPDPTVVVDELAGPAPMAEMGYPLAAAGDVFAAGAMWGERSEVLVYRRAGSGWRLEETLTRADGRTGALEPALTTDGQTIAFKLGGRYQPTRVQIHRHGGTSWVVDGFIDPCPDWEVESVAVQGDLLAIGSDLRYEGNSSGRVDLYRRGADGWKHEAVLTSPDPDEPDRFGASIAIGGDRVFVGAPFEDTAQGDGAGAIHVFEYDPAAPDPAEPPSCSNIERGNWQERAVLLDPEDEDYWAFGIGPMDADRSGTRLLVGHGSTDRALVFTLAGGEWTPSLLVPFPNSEVGGSVAFAGGEESFAVVTTGHQMHLFAEREAGWKQIELIPDEAWSVAASGEAFFAGAPLDGGGGHESGAVTVYGLAGCPAE